MSSSNVHGAAPATLRYRAALIDRVYIVRWYDRFLRKDLEEITREVIAARRKLGSPLHYVSLSSEFTEPFSPEDNEFVKKNALDLLNYIDSLDLVLEAGGVKQMMLRTLFRGAIVAARKGNQVFLHTTGEDALRRIRGSFPGGIHEVIRKAREANLWDPPPG